MILTYFFAFTDYNKYLFLSVLYMIQDFFEKFFKILEKPKFFENKKDTLQNAECLVALYVKRQPQFLSKVQKLFSLVRGREGAFRNAFLPLIIYGAGQKGESK